MDAESAADGRRFHVSRASELASTADCAVDLPVHTDVPRGYSDSIAGDGERAAAYHADQGAYSLSHVLLLRALYETAQVYPPSLAGVPGKNRRSFQCRTPA